MPVMTKWGLFVPHSKADIYYMEKALSYIIRLCQRSSRLGQFRFKSGRCPVSSKNRARHVGRARQIGGCVRLTFPELWNDCAAHGPHPSRARPGKSKMATSAPHPKLDILKGKGLTRQCPAAAGPPLPPPRGGGGGEMVQNGPRNVTP